MMLCTYKVTVMADMREIANSFKMNFSILRTHTHQRYIKVFYRKLAAAPFVGRYQRLLAAVIPLRWSMVQACQ